MGASAGGISIRTDTSLFDPVKVMTDLFGTGFVQLDHYSDTRYPGNFCVETTKDVITIYNSQLVESVFIQPDPVGIKSLFNYFRQPELIFAHERYDSGGTYSYMLIYNGQVKRKFRSVSYETKIDTGDLEEVEKQWRTGEVTKNDLGDGDVEILIKDPVSGHLINEMNLPIVILDQLQLDKLGFDGDESKITGRVFFSHVPVMPGTEQRSSPVKMKQDEAETKPTAKPWWKFW